MNLFIFSEVFRNQNNIIFNTVYKTQLLNEINENKHRENYKPDYNDLKIYAVLYRRYKVYTMIIQRQKVQTFLEYLRENYSIENYRDYHVKNNAYITKQICTIIQEFNDQYKEKGVNMNKNKFNFKGKL